MWEYSVKTSCVLYMLSGYKTSEISWSKIKLGKFLSFYNIPVSLSSDKKKIQESATALGYDVKKFIPPFITIK